MAFNSQWMFFFMGGTAHSYLHHWCWCNFKYEKEKTVNKSVAAENLLHSMLIAFLKQKTTFSSEPISCFLLQCPTDGMLYPCHLKLTYSMRRHRFKDTVTRPSLLMTALTSGVAGITLMAHAMECFVLIPVSTVSMEHMLLFITD